jgi:hypothetical protein
MGKQRQIKVRRRTAKKEIKKELNEKATIVVNDFRAFVKALPLRKRIKLAWKIVTKTY